MTHRSFLPTALLSTLLFAAAAFAAEGVSPEMAPVDVPGDGALTRCATLDPTPEEMAAVAAELKARERELGQMAVGGQIKVVWHVIYYGSSGNIPDSQIHAQIAELNKAYSGFYGGVNTGYTFVLDRITRTSNRQWFAMTPGSKAESNAKNALSVDPARRLNIYSCKPGQSLLGWAYFPNSFPETDKRHGVVIHYGSVPGGYLAPYNLGGTADHEVGHYLGLYHTFQNGCSAPGDYVDDTPFQATATSGCPIGKDTCPSAGLDPIRNYMDYSNDACYTNFTAGQDARMDQMVPLYRPSLLNAAVAQAAPVAPRPEPGFAALHFSNPLPNPFGRETSFRLELPAADDVSVKVYTVSGRLVATLAEGRFAPGQHTLTFRAGGLPAGMYFVAARVGSQLVARRTAVLVP